MKILLIHIRPDQVTRDHEFDCFLNKSGLSPDSFIRINVLDQLPQVDDLKGMDAVIIGGSGKYCISKGDLPEASEAIRKLILAAREQKIPVMGVCYGAQLMAHVMGGKVELDEDNLEMGTFTVTKNDNAKNCPVLADLPESFDVQLGHKDHITKLPKGAINLASSELSKIQAFAFPGENLYAFTFHPELTEEAVLWRIDYYADSYGMTPRKLATFRAQCGPSPVAEKVLQNFLEKVVRQGKTYQI